MDDNDVLPTVTAYVAGPMRGYPEHNFPAFRAAAATLRERGLHVISPHELDEAEGDGPIAGDDEAEYRRLLGRDLDIVANVDMVIVLPGWEASRGAVLEVSVARYLGIPVRRYWPASELGFTDLHPPSSAAPFTSPVAPAVETADVDAAGEERVTNATTGGEKARKKARFDLLPWDCLWQVAEHYGVGASKYASHNWRRGYDWSLSIGALGRHLALFAQGEDVDDETGTPHPAALAFHALALLWFMRAHPDLDDRYKIHTLGTTP